MKKKIIFIILLIILFFILIGIYNISNHPTENEPTNNTLAENQLENQTETTETNENNQQTNTANSTTQTGTNTNANHDTEKTEIAHVSPSGFMGSSLYRVVLYSNGEVYVQTFDGNGYEEENILSQDLIAQNVTSIKEAEDEELYGGVIIEGGEAINTNFGWITFE